MLKCGIFSISTCNRNGSNLVKIRGQSTSYDVRFLRYWFLMVVSYDEMCKIRKSLRRQWKIVKIWYELDFCDSILTLKTNQGGEFSYSDFGSFPPGAIKDKNEDQEFWLIVRVIQLKSVTFNQLYELLEMKKPKIFVQVPFLSWNQHFFQVTSSKFMEK